MLLFRRNIVRDDTLSSISPSWVCQKSDRAFGCPYSSKALIVTALIDCRQKKKLPRTENIQDSVRLYAYKNVSSFLAGAFALKNNTRMPVSRCS